MNFSKYDAQTTVPELKTNTYHPLNSSFTTSNPPKPSKDNPTLNPNRRNSFSSDDKSDLISIKTTTATTQITSLKTPHEFQATKPSSSTKNYLDIQQFPSKGLPTRPAKENDAISGFFPPNSFLKEMNTSTQTANFEGIAANYGNFNTRNSILRPKDNQISFENSTNSRANAANHGFSSKYMPQIPMAMNPALANIMKNTEKSFSQVNLAAALGQTGNSSLGNYKKNVLNAQAELLNYDEDFLPEDCLFLLSEEDNNLASFRENVEKEKAKVSSDVDLMVQDVLNLFEENKVKLLENLDLHYKNYLSKYGNFKEMLIEFKNMKLDIPSKKLHPAYTMDLSNTSNTNLIRELEDLRYQNQMSKMFNYISALQREKLSQIINLSKEILQLSTQVPNYYNSENFTGFLKEIKTSLINAFAKKMQNVHEFVKSLLPKVEAFPANSYHSPNLSNYASNPHEKPQENPLFAPQNPLFSSPFPLNRAETGQMFSDNPVKNVTSSTNFQEELKQFELQATKSHGFPPNNSQSKGFPQQPSHFQHFQAGKPQAFSKEIRCLGVDKEHFCANLSEIPQALSLELSKNFRTDHEDILLCLCVISEDLFAVGSKDSTISLWRASTNSKLGVLEGHRGSICSLSTMKTIKGTYLFSGSDHEDGSIIVWNLQNLTDLDECLVNRLVGHSAAVVALLTLQDGQTVISGSYDKEIFVWNMFSAKTVQKLTGHNSSITCLSLSRDQNRFVSAALDNLINVWKINYKETLGAKAFESCYLERSIKNNTFVCSMVCLGDCRTLATGGKDGKIKLWSLENGENERVLTANLGPIVELLLLDSNGNKNSGNRRESLNNLCSISCSTKDQNLVFTNLGSGNNGILDAQNKVFIEFGCGVSPKLQLLQRNDGELQVVAVNQSEKEKSFSVWNVKFD